MDSGEVILEKPAYNQEYSPPPKGPKSFIKKHCKTCMTLRRLMLYRRRVRKPGGGVTVYWQVYMPPEDSAWTEAWELTRHFLVELDKDVTSSGAELVVFVNTEYMKVCDEWKKEAREYYPDIVIPSEFDLYRPVKRLREITAEHGIRMIDLDPYFLEYKMKHDLKAPYFYFRCDGHYSKLGHAVATDAVYDNLLGLMDRRGLRPITGESKTTIDQ